ncbi:MAG: head-tail connector protein [Oscillospiraceae bacterium]|nr:head-tail connector protein [Oscillospiraceae bacterium]
MKMLLAVIIDFVVMGDDFNHNDDGYILYKTTLSTQGLLRNSSICSDNELLQLYITAAVRYAESYQHLAENYYTEHQMPPTTEQAVIMLSSHVYESRDGSTGSFFADNVQAGQQVWNTVDMLLRMGREYLF